MVKRIIIWSDHAKTELKIILKFFNFRNKSKTYSNHLSNLFKREVKILINHPFIGTKTDTLNVRSFLIENYFVFYEITDIQIIILSVWDTRQNPESSTYNR